MKEKKEEIKEVVKEVKQVPETQTVSLAESQALQMEGWVVCEITRDGEDVKHKLIKEAK